MYLPNIWTFTLDLHTLYAWLLTLTHTTLVCTTNYRTPILLNWQPRDSIRENNSKAFQNILFVSCHGTHKLQWVFFSVFWCCIITSHPKKYLGLIGKIFVKRTIQTSVFLCVIFVPNVKNKNKNKNKKGTVFHNIPKFFKQHLDSDFSLVTFS